MAPVFIAMLGLSIEECFVDFKLLTKILERWDSLRNGPVKCDRRRWIVRVIGGAPFTIPCDMHLQSASSASFTSDWWKTFFWATRSSLANVLEYQKISLLVSKSFQLVCSAKPVRNLMKQHGSRSCFQMWWRCHWKRDETSRLAHLAPRKPVSSSSFSVPLDDVSLMDGWCAKNPARSTALECFELWGVWARLKHTKTNCGDDRS